MTRAADTILARCKARGLRLANRCRAFAAVRDGADDHAEGEELTRGAERSRHHPLACRPNTGAIDSGGSGIEAFRVRIAARPGIDSNGHRPARHGVRRP